MDSDTVYSQPLNISDLGPRINVRRPSKSNNSMKNIFPTSEEKKQNYSHKAVQGINQRYISTKQTPRIETAADVFTQEYPFLLTQKQNTSRKPIFSAQKSQSNDIKFLLPQLHQYTPQAKPPKNQTKSVVSVRQSLDLSVFNYHQIPNLNHTQQRQETVFSIHNLFQSSIQATSRTQSIEKKQQQSKITFPFLGLLGILIAYCVFVSIR